MPGSDGNQLGSSMDSTKIMKPMDSSFCRRDSGGRGFCSKSDALMAFSFSTSGRSTNLQKRMTTVITTRPMIMVQMKYIPSLIIEGFSEMVR